MTAASASLSRSRGRKWSKRIALTEEMLCGGAGVEGGRRHQSTSTASSGKTSHRRPGRGEDEGAIPARWSSCNHRRGPGADKPLDLTIVRERIQLRPVNWELEEGLGHINIDTFTGNVGEQVKSAPPSIDKATGGHPIDYVVDLARPGRPARPGGGRRRRLPRKRRDRLRTRTHEGLHRALSCASGDMAHGLPVIVLTDPGTASASEIVAGALQDHHRAPIMGERSSAGSVQTVVQTGPEAAPRLTTARYYTPSGRSVQAGGIQPDIDVPQSTDPDYMNRKSIREADLRRPFSRRPRSTRSRWKATTRPIRASPPAPRSRRRRASRASSSIMR